MDALQGSVRSNSRDVKDLEQKLFAAPGSAQGSSSRSRPTDAISAAIADVRRPAPGAEEGAEPGSPESKSPTQSDAVRQTLSSLPFCSRGLILLVAWFQGRIRPRVQAIVDELLERMEDVEARCASLLEEQAAAKPKAEGGPTLEELATTVGRQSGCAQPSGP